MRQSYVRIAALLVVVALVSGCAAGRAFRTGESAARAGDWDLAVQQYQRAVQEDPDNPAYRIALERAMISASIAHLDQARVFEARGQLDDALREYRRASEYDPPNRSLAAKVLELERRIRDELEAARPGPSMQELRATARQAAGPPALIGLNEVVAPLVFNNANLRDILDVIGDAAGINITYESTFSDRLYSVDIENVTLAEALDQILTANQLFYKVVNPQTILVIPDNPQKRLQYEDQVVQTFYLSHADVTDLTQWINLVVRMPGQQAAAPTVVPNKTANSIIARAPPAMMEVIGRLIDANDKPRAEVVIDVQILEVSRLRTKQFGLDLGSYAINAIFSPELDPRSAGSSPLFNANTVSRGISTADFYLAVPSAVVRFLESDSETKIIAKPQLRGSEGAQLRLHLGEDVPVITTSFTPIATGGANINPVQSYTYRQIGVRIEMTPRVTYQSEIILDLFLENSTIGESISVGDQLAPIFPTRNVTTRLRLREGESTLLAGLLQDQERRSLSGFPGLLRLPIIRQLFSATNDEIRQTDIIMLLTPRIVRTHELTPEDLAPIYIGTTTNIGLSGPPPLIAQPEVVAPGDVPPVVPAPGAPAPVAPPAPEPVPDPAAAQPEGAQPPGVPVIPPGSTPQPGLTAVPAAAVPGQGPAGGQILVSPPSPDFQVGGGPYTVPISITGASQISSISLTVTYNPAVLRLRAATEGSFMRAGGVAATFTQQPDPASGRIDIAVVRTGDVTGVAGTGLLAALLFDAVGTGPATLSVTATASSPSGMPVPLQFAAIPPVTVR